MLSGSSYNETRKLLSILSGAAELSYDAAAQAVLGIFPPGDRFRGCCAALILVQVREAARCTRSRQRWLAHPPRQPSAPLQAAMSREAGAAPVQDQHLLPVPQRVAVWYSIYKCFSSSDLERNPFLPFIVEVRCCGVCALAAWQAWQLAACAAGRCSHSRAPRRVGHS